MALGLLRYGLVVVLLSFGAFELTEIQAQAIEPLVRHSPFVAGRTEAPACSA